MGDSSFDPGRFAPGQIRTVVTVSACARTHLFVKMDDGTFYERGLPKPTVEAR